MKKIWAILMIAILAVTVLGGLHAAGAEADEDASYTASFKPNAGKDTEAPKDKETGDGDTEA